MRRKAINIADTIARLGLTGFVASLAVSIAFCQISLGVGWLAWLVKCILQRKWDGFRTKMDIWFLFFLAASLLSSVFSIQPGTSFMALKKFYLMTAVYFTAFNLRTFERIEEILDLAVWMTALTGIYGLAMFAFGYQQRLLGTQGMAMTSAGIYMMLGLVSLTGSREVGASRPSWKRWLRRLAPPVMMLSLLLTRTVSSLLGFFTALLVIIKRYFRLVILIVIASIIAGVIYSASDYHRSVRLFKGPKASSGHIRLALWQIGWGLIWERPLTGYGMVDFGEMIRARKTPVDTQYWGDTQRFGHFHNNFVHIAACTGIIGLSAFVTMWTVIFIFLYRTASKCSTEQKSLVKNIIAALVGFMVMGMFEWNFGDSEVVTIVWFLVGLAVAVNHVREQSDEAV
jgi:O-antigen ligase